MTDQQIWQRMANADAARAGLEPPVVPPPRSLVFVACSGRFRLRVCRNRRGAWEFRRFGCDVKAGRFHVGPVLVLFTDFGAHRWSARGVRFVRMYTAADAQRYLGVNP